MMDEMTCEDYELWRAEYNRQPWDCVRDDLRSGIQTAALVNLHLPKEKHLKPADFMPFFKEQKAPQSGADALSMIKARQS